MTAGSTRTASSGGCTATCPRWSAGWRRCSAKARTLALAGVQRHSAYREDPWKRLAGTARWLVVSTFGSAQLAERESARVRGMHRRVKGTLDDGRTYSAGDPDLLRWVHLAFTDAFLAAQTAVGRDMSRFGPRWGDDYVREWARTAERLGATDLPTTRTELAEAIRGYRPVLEPVPDDLLAFLQAPTGLSAPERLVYAGFSGGAARLVSPPSRRWPGCPVARPGRRWTVPSCWSPRPSSARSTWPWARTARARRPRDGAWARAPLPPGRPPWRVDHRQLQVRTRTPGRVRAAPGDDQLRR
ncbi:oxygenase MpaB family protein [Klenkia terrae]|uniref:oxygenase MpaB family protein n=1 Tax=Klenkia terrae TaxID=1052259 RepID=UPI00361BAF67